MSLSGVIFPGQGSQRNGMALDFRDKFPEAKQIFEAASEVLSLDMVQICRGESDTRLDLTEYAQPCILTAEIAMYESLRVHFGLKAELFGGHSLGEYTALVAAGALPFESAVRIVRERGRMMQKAVLPDVGAMAAVIQENLPHDEIRAVAGDYGVDVANDNSTSQVVISGERAPVEKVCAILQERYQATGLRIDFLPVSAPFHSRHMAVIESEFRSLLEKECPSFEAEKAIHVTSNFTGNFHTGNLGDLIDSLTRQISQRVCWRDNMAALKEKTATFYEIGPNRPLTGFFKTLGVSARAVIDFRTAQRVFFRQ